MEELEENSSIFYWWVFFDFYSYFKQHLLYFPFLLVMIYFTQRHSFHLVDPSVMPLLSSISSLLLTLGSVMYFHGHYFGLLITFLGFIFILLSMFLWWRDVVRESTFEGHHTNIVQLGLRYAVILFIISEVMFFFAFFWSFFASSLAPTSEIGGVWPPKGIDTFDPKAIPLLNTLILLTSGATVTYCHHSVTAGNKVDAIWALSLTVILAFLFTLLQSFEYATANFTIADGIYGSIFFMATGFHGFHVLIGSFFLVVCLLRLSLDHFTVQHHFGFEAAAFYWHFVDVVWLILYVVVYFWGG